MLCLSAPCSAETVPPTALSLQLCFGAAEFLSYPPHSKLFDLVVAALVDEPVSWTVVAVDEGVHSLAVAPGFAVEDVQFPVAVLGLAAVGLAPVSSGCPHPAHSPLHFGPAACSLHTEVLLSAQIMCC